MNEERDKGLARLREPFPPEQIGHLPKGGTRLSYVGHAAVTDRLLEVDPLWTWEPYAVDDTGPAIAASGKNSVLWIKLTVCGMTRTGVGIVATSAFELEKQLISDAIRNAAMRFGVALDLWSKEDLQGVAGGSADRSGESTRPTSPAADPSVISELVAAVTHNGLEQWVKDQSFPWPWTEQVCDAVLAKIDTMREPF